MYENHDARPLVVSIVRVLQEVFGEHTQISQALQHLFKKNQWSAHEKEQVSETVYDIIRFWRLLWYVYGKQQSLYEDDLFSIVKIHQMVYNKYDIKLPKKVLLSLDHVQNRLHQASSQRAIRESIPDWLDTQGFTELGNRWEPLLISLNKKPNRIIRVNTLKGSREHLQQQLEKEGVRTILLPQFPDALQLEHDTNVFKLHGFSQGLFEVQDAASQMVSRFLNPKPGMLVVDACAGEGSKTLHLAALMNNKGRIIALDTASWRLKELRRRATRAGADNIEIRHIDTTKTSKRLIGKVDKLLLDVPCSGLGTLRRNPDIKWMLAPETLDRIRRLQHNLLSHYTPLVKPNGCFVYATCSILPSEGEHVIRTFLSEQDDEFRLLKEQRYWPDIHGTDGFYMALLERTAPQSSESFKQ